MPPVEEAVVGRTPCCCWCCIKNYSNMDPVWSPSARLLHILVIKSLAVSIFSQSQYKPPPSLDFSSSSDLIPLGCGQPPPPLLLLRHLFRLSTCTPTREAVVDGSPTCCCLFCWCCHCTKNASAMSPIKSCFAKLPHIVVVAAAYMTVLAIFDQLQSQWPRLPPLLLLLLQYLVGIVGG